MICGDFAKTISSLITIPYNIVFLDPPFYKNLLEKAASGLREKQLLAPNSFIYVETEKNLKSLVVPENWKIYRMKKTLTLSYLLFQSVRH